MSNITLDTTTRGHHPFSPSTLQAREACAGFRGEQRPSPESERGIYLHDCVARYLKGEGLDPGLDDEGAKAVLSCVKFVHDRENEMGPGALSISEEYLPIDNEETTAGYLDYGLVNLETRKAKIIDWKMGQGEVEPTANNLQGISYMLGLDYKHDHQIDECEVIFGMPFQGGEGWIDSHIFTAKEFDQLHLRICIIVAKAKDAAADFESHEILNTWRQKLRPSNGTCLFCERKPVCPAVGALAVVAGKKYDPLIVPDVINPMLIKDAKEAGAALKFFQVMEALAKAYRARATDKAFNDEVWVPEGYYITTMTARKITDNRKFAETIRPLLTEDEFINAISFTLGAVEDAIKAKTPLGKKTEAIEELGRLLEMNGATRQSEPIIQLRQRKTAGKVDSIAPPR